MSFFLFRFIRTFEVVRAVNNVYEGAADVDAEQNQNRCIHFPMQETHTAFPGTPPFSDAAAFCFPAGRVPCGKRCADGLFFRFFVIVVVFFVRPPDQIINERYGGERQTDGSEDQTADAEGGRAFFAVFHFHRRKHKQCLPVHLLSDSIRSI